MSEMKIGMVGLDTSHVTGFADCFNLPDHRFHLPGARIAKAFPRGSALFSLSRSRVGQFTSELRGKYGVGIAGSIEELAGLDAYFLESVDGAQHLEQFRQLAEFGKPVFVDKPLACSYADAKAIFELAREKGIPLMTASSMRFAAGVGDVLPAGAAVFAAEGFGPLAFLPDYRDYFWYGIHTAEIVYRYLGRGCEEVRSISGSGIELVTGRWKDGRIGQITGNSVGSGNFGVLLVTGEGHRVSVQNADIPYMFPMAAAILEFFRSGVSPVDPAESLEIIAFLEAASRSRASGGKTVTLSEL